MAEMTDKPSRSQEVYASLRQIVQAMDVHSKYLHKYYGLSGPQLNILKELSNVDKIPTGHLAKKISVSQATVTDILDRLEERGFVLRERSHTDKRKVYIQITEKGKIIISKNPSLLQKDFIRQFDELEAWEQTSILSSTQRIVAMMQTPALKEKIEKIKRA